MKPHFVHLAVVLVHKEVASSVTVSPGVGLQLDMPNIISPHDVSMMCLLIIKSLQPWLRGLVAVPSVESYNVNKLIQGVI